MIGANARRVRQIAEQFPSVRISVLAENQEQLSAWRDGLVSIFLDINPGMNRTGIEQSHSNAVIALVGAIRANGLEFRGLHYYGQYGGLSESERTAAAHTGYDQLLKVTAEIERSGISVPEIVTAGTPTFPCSLAYERFRNGPFIHRISPGTIVYNDATTLAQLPSAYGYQPAVVVATRVVS